MQTFTCARAFGDAEHWGGCQEDMEARPRGVGLGPQAQSVGVLPTPAGLSTATSR